MSFYEGRYPISTFLAKWVLQRAHPIFDATHPVLGSARSRMCCRPSPCRRAEEGHRCCEDIPTSLYDYVPMTSERRARKLAQAALSPLRLLPLFDEQAEMVRRVHVLLDGLSQAEDRLGLAMQVIDCCHEAAAVKALVGEEAALEER